MVVEPGVVEGAVLAVGARRERVLKVLAAHVLGSPLDAQKFHASAWTIGTGLDGQEMARARNDGGVLRVVRLLLVFVACSACSAIALIVTAPPASAHATGGPQPSDYNTIVRRISPPLPGVTVRSIDLGNELELRNETHTDVLVLGYEHEPYLRIGPNGVFRNERSPATFLNRTRVVTQTAPAAFNASAQPSWQQIGRGRVTRWHDHRAHWMAPNDPPSVTRDPHRPHVVIRDFEIELVANGRRHIVVGDVVWTPGPSPWRWLALSLAIALILGLTARSRIIVPLLIVCVVTFLVLEAMVLVGGWTWFVGTGWQRVGNSGYGVAAWLLVITGLLVVLARGMYRAAPTLLIAAVAVLFGAGLDNIPALWSAHVPNDLAATGVRAATSVSLGLGVGLAAAAAQRLGRPQDAFVPSDVRPEVAVQPLAPE
jgi:hypothetical protein